MISIDPSRWKLPPYAHQVQGVKDLIAKPVLGLFWQMRCGKSKTVIDAACELHQAGELDVVVVVAPAQVIEVWKDKQIGEIATHCWTEYTICSFDRKHVYDTSKGWGLIFYLMSLEFMRQEGSKACSYPKVDELLFVIQGLRSWLVIDEGSALGSPTSAQTRAVLQLRKGFERVTILDGTPAGDSTKAVYSKFKVLDPYILGYKNQKQFLLRHAIYDKPGRYQRVVGYKNLELITEKTAPYVSRVEAKDVLDMPAKVNSFITVPLCPKTWDIYRRLRDDAIVQLDRADDLRDRPPVLLTVQHAPVMVLRLAQICAGFLGGLNAEEAGTKNGVEELSSEATDSLLSWLRLRLDEDPSFKCVVWSRWRAEIERLNKLIIEKFEIEHGTMWGDVKDENFLHPRYSACPTFTAGVMVCQPQAAQYGVSFARASTEVFLSQGYSLVTRQQSEDRIQAPETRSHSYLVDVVVTGPKGERTVTHDIRAVLLKKENVALRTIAGWKAVLENE